MSTKVTLTLNKSELVFSAAHFLVGFGKCDRLHGHNYATKFEFKGELGTKDALIDFSELKKKLSSIIKELDHKIILPEKSSEIQIKAQDGEYYITKGMKKYILPSEDCVLLPIPATTCEWLTQYLYERVKAHYSLEIRVTVEETLGAKASSGDW